MALMSDEDRGFLQKHFQQELQQPVKIHYFTQRQSPLVIPGVQVQECAYCKETHQLLEEITSLSPNLQLEVHDFVAEAQLAQTLGVDKIPATVLESDGRNNLRYYGIPSGYEFATIIEGIVDVSRGDSELSTKTKEALAALAEDVHIQVMVTPT